MKPKDDRILATENEMLMGKLFASQQCTIVRITYVYIVFAHKIYYFEKGKLHHEDRDGTWQVCK
eukprot:Gb_37852 [translate_table: standard]